MMITWVVMWSPGVVLNRSTRSGKIIVTSPNLTCYLKGDVHRKVS